MSTTSRQESLLAALQRKSTPAAPPPPAPAPIRNDATAAPRRIGKPVQFWLHEEDRRIVRELSAWLSGQGIRPSDSLVVRTALRLAQTGPALLHAYQEIAKLDGRLKQSQHHQ